MPILILSYSDLKSYLYEYLRLLEFNHIKWTMTVDTLLTVTFPGYQQKCRYVLDQCHVTHITVITGLVCC